MMDACVLGRVGVHNKAGSLLHRVIMSPLFIPLPSILQQPEQHQRGGSRLKKLGRGFHLPKLGKEESSKLITEGKKQVSE